MMSHFLQKKALLLENLHQLLSAHQVLKSLAFLQNFPGPPKANSKIFDQKNAKFYFLFTRAFVSLVLNSSKSKGEFKNEPSTCSHVLQAFLHRIVSLSLEMK